MTYTQLKTPDLDPVIYSGNKPLTSWAGWCLAYVEVAFGTQRLYGSAWEAWLATKHRNHTTDFPRNVYFPVWFSHFGTYNGKYGNWGHVVICRVSDNGTMTIWSSPASAKPYADIYYSISEIERVYSSKFVGWSEDIARTQVIQPLGGEEEMKLEDYLSDIFDVIADDPHYAESRPDVFKSHLAHVRGLDWAGRRAWFKQILADNGVLNATNMRKHREDDAVAMQEAFDKGVASEVAVSTLKLQEKESQLKEAEVRFTRAVEELTTSHQAQLQAKDQELAEMETLLKKAQQNAKEPARWTWQEHLRAAIRAFMNGGDK